MFYFIIVLIIIKFIRKLTVSGNVGGFAVDGVSPVASQVRRVPG